jgi:hypothetical protein
MGGFHPGELRAQTRAGLRAEADRVGGIIRDRVPPVAARFLAEQVMLVIGARDGADRMWCSLLTGPAGFLKASEDVLDVAARPLSTDPLAEVLTGPAKLGALALDPNGRRRMRINGTATPTPSGLRIEVAQAYANCPKYIQRRHPERWAADAAAGEPTVTDGLDRTGREMVERADTFFVATSAATGDCDASHRGGLPGFLRVVGDNELSWPDYPGNAMLMTLGNLEQYPGTGLLLVDWAGGATLALTGTARVDWSGAERHVRFQVGQARRTALASPLRWSVPEFSRFNPPVSPVVGRSGG